MSDLLDKLQSASQGSYKLSCEVGDFMGAERRYEHPGAAEPSHRHYTTNLQDAVSLKTATQELTIAISDRGSCHVLEAGSVMAHVTAATAPLAVCGAIIKAHASKAEAA